MDLNNIDDQSEKKEPEELFQECWFFGNLLQSGSTSSRNNKKPKSMLRSFSDPCTSSSSSYGGQGFLTDDKSYEEAYNSIKILEEFESPPRLKKAPSMPTTGRRKPTKSNNKKAPSSTTTTTAVLLRAPSLPACLVESSDDDDEEVDFSMGKLIRQASMKCRSSADTLPPPRTHGGASKQVLLTPSSSMSRQRSMKEREGSEDVMASRVRMKQLQPQKSLNTSIDYEELNGFMDLGFHFEKMELDRSPPPNLRERKRTEEEKDLTRRRWGAPPVPRRGGKRSTSSNDVTMMKEQIKFWARAVASNVRQEC